MNISVSVLVFVFFVAMVFILSIKTMFLSKNKIIEQYGSISYDKKTVTTTREAIQQDGSTSQIVSQLGNLLEKFDKPKYTELKNSSNFTSLIVKLPIIEYVLKQLKIQYDQKIDRFLTNPDGMKYIDGERKDAYMERIRKYVDDNLYQIMQFDYVRLPFARDDPETRKYLNDGWVISIQLYSFYKLLENKSSELDHMWF
tara:strand:- start:22 stop:618 length:597 start_codon:yes stop_codon:yes gene_type:complete